jgi:hypothetical protein
MEASGYSLAGFRKPVRLRAGNFFTGLALYYYDRPENACARNPFNFISQWDQKILAENAKKLAFLLDKSKTRC